MASQELEAGDVLRRFKAEVSQDEPRRGNNTDRFILGLLAFSVWKLLFYMAFLLLALRGFLFFGGSCMFE